MGHMMDGKWVDDDRITADTRGAFVRADSQFRSWITADGAAGPSGSAGFKAEPGRYHLFVSYNCPWAHRAIIFRKLKKLEDVISMSLADKPKAHGWAYSEAIDDFRPEDDGIFRLHQVYAAADPKYTGKVTVPTFWDRERRTIVNNESSEIIRMLNSAFGRLRRSTTISIRKICAAEIDRINDLVYSHFNNGVYRAGFARVRKPTKKRLEKFFLSRRVWNACSVRGVTSRGSVSPKPIGAFFRLCCVSIWSTTAISSATSPGSGLPESGELSTRTLSMARNQRHFRFAEN